MLMTANMMSFTAGANSVFVCHAAQVMTARSAVVDVRAALEELAQTPTALMPQANTQSLASSCLPKGSFSSSSCLFNLDASSLAVISETSLALITPAEQVMDLMSHPQFRKCLREAELGLSVSEHYLPDALAEALYTGGVLIVTPILSVIVGGLIYQLISPHPIESLFSSFVLIYGMLALPLSSMFHWQEASRDGTGLIKQGQAYFARRALPEQLSALPASSQRIIAALCASTDTTTGRVDVIEWIAKGIHVVPEAEKSFWWDMLQTHIKDDLNSFVEGINVLNQWRERYSDWRGKIEIYLEELSRTDLAKELFNLSVEPSPGRGDRPVAPTDRLKIQSAIAVLKPYFNSQPFR